MKSLIICGATGPILKELQSKMPQVKLVTIYQAIQFIQKSKPLKKSIKKLPHLVW